MFFRLLLIISAAALAGAAGFFSIYGLSQIYAAAAIAIIIMGASLELGKLMTASFLYRHWKTSHWALKTYLTVALLVLMSITSIGVFGFLTAAVQKDNIPLTEISQKVESDKVELQRYIDRKNQIDQQVSSVSNNAVKSKRQLMQSFNEEYKGLQPKIDALTTEINELQTRQVNVEAKIGPIMYVAQALGLDPKSAVVILTLLIVSVFDPLAVALTIAVNHSVEKDKKPEPKADPVPEPKPEPVIELPVEMPKVTEPEIILPTEPIQVTQLPSAREETLEKIRLSIAASQGSVID
jgi:hypothetical protein